MVQWLTDFGDQALVLPVLAVVAGLLWLQRRHREAGAWLLAVIGVLGTMAVLKSASYACGWTWPALDPRLAIRSPSGHAASATVLYGCLAGLAASRTRLGLRAATLLAAAAAGVAVAVTRVQLGVHSPGEVVLGLAVGLVGALAFARLAPSLPARPPALAALLGALAIVALQHGRHLAAEQAVQDHGARFLRQLISACAPP